MTLADESTIPDPTRNRSRLGALEQKVAQLASSTAAFAKGTIDGTRGLTILNAAKVAVTRFGVDGLQILTGGRLVIFGSGRIATFANGSFGVATDDGAGNVTTPSMLMQPDSALFDAGPGKGFSNFGTDSTAGFARIANSLNIVKIGHLTTSSAANVVLLLDGQLLRSTSARIYKRAIRPAYFDVEKIARIRLRTWIDRNDTARYPRRHTGVIAEELVDLGLDRFVTRGYTDQPEAVEYERVALVAGVTAAQEVVALRGRVVELEQTLFEMADRLAALEAKES